MASGRCREENESHQCFAKLGREVGEGVCWLEGAWQGAGSSWASDAVRVWGAGWRRQDRDGRGNLQGLNLEAEVTGFVLGKGSL